MRFDLLFINLEMLRAFSPDMGYKAALQPFWHLYPSIQIIVMAAPESIREAITAVKAGASDNITYPINPHELKYIVENIKETVILQSELNYLHDQFWEVDSREIVHTNNDEMKNVLDKIRSVASTKSTVLLSGETGTGKGVLAKLIHQHSNRRNAPFISMHCSAIP
ncbi:Fis family transcriptional regulator, partial [Desulfobacteraceae bacterium SEEP-SAG9]